MYTNAYVAMDKYPDYQAALYMMINTCLFSCYRCYRLKKLILTTNNLLTLPEGLYFLNLEVMVLCTVYRECVVICKCCMMSHVPLTYNLAEFLPPS